ncbi:MAG: sigma-70 family RNA polymerase sigma factor [Gemmataceae bacterium]|nr:sigma-70 family RNA polymerase sigma factor [Gemmataceae bacterium]MCI0740394.1 sigma-70 family RNA polymerase sigma factor [Gemmataceae bacterium]
MVQQESLTSVTLLWRLQQQPSDQAAWREFVERYGRRIHGWCRQWGLQEADAQDIVQIVLLKLVGAVQTFRYDPSQSFRGWLKTVTHHAWQDLARGRRRLAAAGNGAADDPLLTLAARDDLAARLEAAYEQEVLDQALVRVRPRVQPQTWDAFRLTALDGLSGAATAAQLGMRVTSVYKAKSNVQKLLEAEVRYLEGGQV